MGKATRYQLIVAVMGVLALLVVGLLPSYAEDNAGVIGGKVQNKTAGGGSVADLAVTLRTFAHQSDGGTATTTTDKEGNYRFDKLSTANTYAYGVVVEYQGIDYGSDLLVFEEGTTTASADISVFETTDKPDAIGIDRAHVILEVREATQVLPVTEILVITNSGDRTFVPSSPAKGSLHVALPAGALDLQLEPDLADSSMAVDDGFVYAGPVQPGNSRIMFAYALSYQSGNFDLIRTYDYPIKQLSFLMPDGQVRAASEKLAAQPPLQLTQQGGKYMHLLGDNVPAGTPVTIRLQGLPTPSALSFLSRLPIWAYPGALAVLAAALLGVVLLRRRRASSFEDDQELLDDDTDAEYRTRRTADEAVDDDDLIDEYAEEEDDAPADVSAKHGK